MEYRRLKRAFRGAMRAALPVGVGVLGVAGCGGLSEANAGAPDASTDAPAHIDADSAPVCPVGEAGQVCVAMWDVPIPPGCLELPADAGSTVPEADCVRICGPGRTGCSAFEGDGGLTVECDPMCTGRRPAAFVDDAPAARGAGAWFGRVAALEAASIAAFRTLARELVHHGAPPALVRSAQAAARDEMRHTRSMGALARRFGSAARAVAFPLAPVRGLEAIATENAVEGCVRETYGALLATWQAGHATDPVVRAAMQVVARDETRHAALAWRVARWIEQRLDAPARARVARARRAAVDELERSCARPVPPELVQLAGMPGAAQSAALVESLGCSLWSGA